MDIHHFKVFRAAARAGSFTAAGREVSLSQSTVSLHIKQLEEEFGCALFTRSRRRVSLSDAGRVLVLYVDRIFAEMENAELAVREFSSTHRGTIRLGTGDTPLIYLLPKPLSEYRRKFPLIEILVTTEITEVVLQQLLAKSIDLGIVMSPADALKSVEALPLMTEELVIVLATEHRLASQRELLPNDLTELEFISHLRGTALRTVQQHYFDELGVQPRIGLDVLPVVVGTDEERVLVTPLALPEGTRLPGENGQDLASLDHEDVLELGNEAWVGREQGDTLVDLGCSHVKKAGLLAQQIPYLRLLGGVLLEQILLDKLGHAFAVNDKIVVALLDAVDVLGNVIKAGVVEERLLYACHEDEP